MGFLNEPASPNQSAQTKNNCSAKQKPERLHFKVGNPRTVGYKLSLLYAYVINKKIRFPFTQESTGGSQNHSELAELK